MFTKPIDGDFIGYWSGRVTLTFHTPCREEFMNGGKVRTYPNVEGILGPLELDKEFAVALFVDQFDIVARDHDPRHVLSAALVRLN